MSKQDYREIEVVGPADLVASWRLHMQESVRYIVEESPLRIRAVLDIRELPFYSEWANKEVRILGDKVFVFLREENLNGNIDHMARMLNR